MRIGYACINQSIGCTSSSTFRLKSYTEERLISTVEQNLKCLKRILKFNVENDILLFRITSDLVPFASHPICTFDWQSHFTNEFQEIGKFARENGMRLTLHPGQYTVLNSKTEQVITNSINELQYHADILDLLEMDLSAKIQIHVGGVYGDKESAIERFITTYDRLENAIGRRLIIENDEKSYSLHDCLSIHNEIGIPVVFDNLHHDVNNNGEPLHEALLIMSETWKRERMTPLVHYSSQEAGSRPGKHALQLDAAHFKKFLEETSDYNFDLMLEIKSKEKAAKKAISIARNDPRFIETTI